MQEPTIKEVEWIAEINLRSLPHYHIDTDLNVVKVCFPVHAFQAVLNTLLRHSLFGEVIAEVEGQ